MIKNPMSKPGYCEEYDIEALRELADMAFNYVVIENGCNIGEKMTTKKSIPDGSFSDFSCNVWELMTNLIRDGMALEKSLSS